MIKGDVDLNDADDVPCRALLRSFTHFLTGVCAIIGGVFTGQSLSLSVCVSAWTNTEA